MPQDQPKELIPQPFYPQPFYSRQPPTAEDFKRVEEFRQRASAELVEENDNFDVANWLVGSLHAATIKIEHVHGVASLQTPLVIITAIIQESGIKEFEGKVVSFYEGSFDKALVGTVRHVIISAHEPPQSKLPYGVAKNPPRNTRDLGNKWRTRVGLGEVRPGPDGKRISIYGFVGF